MDWDDLKVFMAVARAGSLRAASRVLEVNNTTVSRRIRRFEARLGARLFDRTPGGYAITAAGEEILAAARRIEAEVQGVERRLSGHDARLSGDIVFTAPDSALLRLLMPDLVAFMDLYPEVTLEIDMSLETANLSAREADVALRATTRPPDHLIGRKVARIAQAPYATPDYLAKHDLVEDPGAARWLGWHDRVALPDWVRDGPLPETPVRGRIPSDVCQLEAAKAGAGIALLPCYLGDSDPALVRVPPGRPLGSHEYWLLTHRDLLATARLRTFWDYLLEVMKRRQPLIEGLCPRAAGRAPA